MTMQPTDKEKEISNIIMPEMNDKLKEIRDKYIQPFQDFDYINAIQSETYQLGRDEERKEIYDKIYNYFNGENKTRLTTNSVIVINDILTQLKSK